MSDAECDKKVDQIINRVYRSEEYTWGKARRAGCTREGWLRQKSIECVKEYTRRCNEKPRFYTTEKERIDSTNVEISKDGEVQGKWEGERGKSTFKPKQNSKNKSAIDFLKKNKMEGLEYRDGVADFYLLSEATVEIDRMTSDRPGNFTQAYKSLAEKWNKEERDDRTNWTYKDVKEWAKDPSKHDGQILTIHENPDCKTCEFIRDDVHTCFRHAGGVAECKRRDGEYDNGGFDE